MSDEERGKSIPEPEPRVIQMQDLLERGWPGEIVPGPQLERARLAAQSYVGDQSNPPDARERVRKVWLQGSYQPSYQKFTPRPQADPDFG